MSMIFQDKLALEYASVEEAIKMLQEFKKKADAVGAKSTKLYFHAHHSWASDSQVREVVGCAYTQKP